MTGAVLKKARARSLVCILDVRHQSVYCAVVHGECWKQPHQERLIQHRLDAFQVTASDFGVERRSSVEGGQQDSLESSPL